MIASEDEEPEAMPSIFINLLSCKIFFYEAVIWTPTLQLQTWVRISVNCYCANDPLECKDRKRDGSNEVLITRRTKRLATCNKKGFHFLVLYQPISEKGREPSYYKGHCKKSPLSEGPKQVGS